MAKSVVWYNYVLTSITIPKLVLQLIKSLILRNTNLFKDYTIVEK